MQTLEFDTVVVGSGLAGLTAAYHSSRFGSVVLITKSELDTSNSYYAQGGVAAALAPDDSPEYHLRDTIKAGRGLCDYDAVKTLVYEGRERLLEVIDMGMEFDKIGGQLNFGLEGGHSKRRILHADGDATGKKLTGFMLKKVKEQKTITTFEYTAAVKLLKHENRVVGVQAIDFVGHRNICFKAGAVILATGGYSRVYARSTNPHTATGDGIAMAYEAGAKIADIEFVQFHPSALLVPGEDAYLISEAVRGEGAWLLNEKGERFMKEIHPLAELAPRDIVSFAIYREIRKSKAGIVYLSLKHLDPKKIKKRFHNIFEKLKEFGFDMTNDDLPIAPAAHYMVGGIRSGLNGETNVEGLFVCGETASTGVMGATRLASNSLPECLVFGKRTSEKAAKLKPEVCSLQEQEDINIDPANESTFLRIKNEIAELMAEQVGVVRNREGLESARERLKAILKKYSGDVNEYNLLKIRNVATVALLIAEAALTREESRGGHIREDFQALNPGFRVHTIQMKGTDLTFEEVRNQNYE